MRTDTDATVATRTTLAARRLHPSAHDVEGADGDGAVVRRGVVGVGGERMQLQCCLHDIVVGITGVADEFTPCAQAFEVGHSYSVTVLRVKIPSKAVMTGSDRLSALVYSVPFMPCVSPTPHSEIRILP